MNRRRFLKVALPTLGLACIGASPALCESLEEKVVKALRRQGYSDINTNRTLLGRLRVTAEKGEKHREVILNRQTGEVLRDVIIGRGGAASVFGGDDSDDRSSDTSGDDGGNSGSGGGSDDGDSDGGDDSDGGGDSDGDSDGGSDD